MLLRCGHAEGDVMDATAPQAFARQVVSRVYMHLGPRTADARTEYQNVARGSLGGGVASALREAHDVGKHARGWLGVAYGESDRAKAADALWCGCWALVPRGAAG